MSDMTDERKAALNWVEEAFTGRGMPDAEDAKHKATLKAMLAEPRLPKEPDREMLRIYSHGGVVEPEETHRLIRAHLTAHPVDPSPKVLPPHVTIRQTGTNPNSVIETCVEAMVRAGLMTVDGSIGDRINRRIAADAKSPATKTVEVWRVEYATKWTEDDGTVWRPAGQTFPEREGADREAVRLSGNPHYNRCIRVTGPHKQEIPA